MYYCFYACLVVCQVSVCVADHPLSAEIQGLGKLPSANVPKTLDLPRQARDLMQRERVGRLSAVRTDNRIFPNLMADDMPLMSRINEVYSQNLDVYPEGALLHLLSQEFPSRRDKWESILDRRVNDRANDHFLIELVDQESKEDVSKLVKQIADEEAKRSKAASDAIERELDASERSQLCGHLLKLHKLRAVKFSLVRHDLGLTQDQVSVILKESQKGQHAIALALKDGTYDPEHSPAARSHAESLKVLSRSQIAKYFGYCGLIKEGESISAALQHFPKSGQDLLAEVLKAKELER